MWDVPYVVPGYIPPQIARCIWSFAQVVFARGKFCVLFVDYSPPPDPFVICLSTINNSCLLLYPSLTMCIPTQWRTLSLVFDVMRFSSVNMFLLDHLLVASRTWRVLWWCGHHAGCCAYCSSYVPRCWPPSAILAREVSAFSCWLHAFLLTLFASPL